MSDEILQVEALAGGLERVTLNRPERLNALNHPMAEALLAHFEGRRRDADTRVIIVRGAGRAFSAGADLKAAGQPDALRLTKRSLDATLEAVSLDVALEIEERAQMLMIARR